MASACYKKREAGGIQASCPEQTENIEQNKERSSMFSMQDFELNGKVALVTGASYGIGFAIACALAKAGARIAFNARRPDAINKAKVAYGKEGIDARGYVCDVTDENAVMKMIGAIEQDLGPVDILVNNAGIIKRIPMLAMCVQDFQEVVDIDLVGPFIMAKAVLPSMISRHQGKIINICSLMSEVGRENVSAYAAAKGGLKMLTRNIAAEYGSYNIQCNAIAPGYIATPQTAPLRTPQPDGSANPFERFVLSRTPQQRWGRPDDLMGPAVFLASAASDFVNGQILLVDGGLLASLGKPEEQKEQKEQKEN